MRKWGGKEKTGTSMLFFISKTKQKCYGLVMNSNEFKRWLEKQGATFKPGKGGHLKVFLDGKRSVLPMHGKCELSQPLVESIKK